MSCGATDVGIVSLESFKDEEINKIKEIFPKTRALISIAVKHNPNAIKSQHRSVSNNEYHYAIKKLHKVTYDLENELIKKGMEVVAAVADFPMETDISRPNAWLISHKEVAVKAGIGKMGLNTLVIHEIYGPNIILNTILIDYEPDKYDKEIEENPCINCNLCKTVCPTGSISEDGFNFTGCYTHNYRDMRNGFLDLTNRLESGNKKLDKINSAEKSAIWQSVYSGPNYRCSYCVAVCPAAKGEVENFKKDRKAYYDTYVKPFKEKEENIYVLKGSDSDYYVDKLEKKRKKYVSNGMEMRNVQYFRNALKLGFQKNHAKDVEVIYHFIFTGEENLQFTVDINRGKLKVTDGLAGKPNLVLNADSRKWVEFLSTGKGLMTGIITGKIKIKGSPKLLKEFSKYFPN
ncbi:SCP2 sterol-binding domain-containing protein [Anaeromicrobium sediminis]|uniref:4Fe-4S ferredoxin-type domain-containing protein n=1 Tax=Anaeromicrobium sediminis TaxID=1478221 RepID=A0A267MHQ9_9FIRM|nr:SCP2 sterol-binding domain-containing protein [Anaeromicrobium sediminis]PAB58340.1 hypothetical protein CCE28_15490 [Anaeromicrobium sediminis]